MSVVVREAGPADADRLSLVGRATFLETFAGILDGQGLLDHCAHRHAADVYAGWLADGRSRLWLAEAAGAPVGYAVTAEPDLPAPDPLPGDVEVKRIYLLGRFQGQGLGRKLMETALAAARHDGRRRALLGVYAGNASAISFYGRLGFEVVGSRRFQVGGAFYDDAVLARPL